MGIFDFLKPKEETRAAAPSSKRSIAFLGVDRWDDVIRAGHYVTLADCPEVQTAVRKIADLIGSMTIYLMANTKNGDIRVINELSKKVDIYPTKTMTRKTWMTAIIMNLLLYGRGNSVVQVHMKREKLPNGSTRNILGDLEPITAERVGFKEIDKGRDYIVTIDGKDYDPSENLLHFVYNPNARHLWLGEGLTASLKDIADNLKQEQKTTNAFMSSKWKPTMVVKVDALVDEFSSPEGRQKLLNEYVKSSSMGEPWLIPRDQFDVEQIRPLSLTDLAIDKAIELDRRMVASIIGVPPFVLGVGRFNRDEWNAFVNNTVRPIAQEIEQELTRKLLISDKMYWHFNLSSLYSYDLQTMATVYSDLYTKGLVTGNEVRDKIGMSPKEELEDLIILENYIPADKIGDQNKLN